MGDNPSVPRPAQRHRANMSATEEQLLTLFGKFFKCCDEDGNGKLSKEEIMKAMPNDASKMIKDCDADGDGMVSWEEFSSFLKKKHAEDPCPANEIEHLTEFFKQMFGDKWE